VKLISRLCLIFCALSIFINVALGGTLLSTKKLTFSAKQESKAIVFQKVVEDFHLNATEFEEDVELDGDEDLDFDFHIVSYHTAPTTYQFQFPFFHSSKIEFSHIDYRSIRKIPFFITYENFRI